MSGSRNAWNDRTDILTERVPAVRTGGDLGRTIGCQRASALLRFIEPISLMGIVARATPIELLGAIVSRA
jgi:hypothetical protein